MTYHECSIEPYDWNNGDGDASEADECPKCHGEGTLPGDGDDEYACPSCQGSGFADAGETDSDDDWRYD